MKKIFLLFTFSLFFGNFACADNTADIKDVNARVAKIDNTKAKLNALELKLHTAEMEAVPPEVMYYFDPANKKLVMIQVSVGHEIFSTIHTYYVDNNHVIKYVKDTLNHPDAPPKQAVIYNQDGGVLWKNTGEPAVSSKQAMDLFQLNMSVLAGFAKY